MWLKPFPSYVIIGAFRKKRMIPERCPQGWPFLLRLFHPSAVHPSAVTITRRCSRFLNSLRIFTDRQSRDSGTWALRNLPSRIFLRAWNQQTDWEDVKHIRHILSGKEAETFYATLSRPTAPRKRAGKPPKEPQKQLSPNAEAGKAPCNSVGGLLPKRKERGQRNGIQSCKEGSGSHRNC